MTISTIKKSQLINISPQASRLQIDWMLMFTSHHTEPITHIFDAGRLNIPEDLMEPMIAQGWRSPLPTPKPEPYYSTTEIKTTGTTEPSVTANTTSQEESFENTPEQANENVTATNDTTEEILHRVKRDAVQELELPCLIEDPDCQYYDQASNSSNSFLGKLSMLYSSYLHPLRRQKRQPYLLQNSLTYEKLEENQLDHNGEDGGQTNDTSSSANEENIPANNGTTDPEPPTTTLPILTEETAEIISTEVYQTDDLQASSQSSMTTDSSEAPETTANATVEVPPELIEAPDPDKPKPYNLTEFFTQLNTMKQRKCFNMK